MNILGVILGVLFVLTLGALVIAMLWGCIVGAWECFQNGDYVAALAAVLFCVMILSLIVVPYSQ